MTLITEKKQIKSSMFCSLLNKEIDVIEINNVNYADWKTSNKWLPDNWKTGTIMFEALNPEKLNSFAYSKAMDVASGIEFKILNPSLDSDGNPSFKRLNFNSNKKFDLEDINKRAEAFILANQDFVMGGIGTNKYNYVKMTSIEDGAKENREKRKQLRDVMALVDNMEGQELRDFARLLVPVSDVETDVIIKDRLEELAEKKAYVILQEYKRTDRAAREVFKRAVDYNVLEFKRDLGYIFSGNKIGYNEIEVLTRMKDDPMIMSSIHNQTAVIINKTLKARLRARPEQKIIEKSNPAQLGDKSVSDMEREYVAKESLKEQGIDTMGFLDQISERLSLTIDEKLSPMEKKLKELARKQESLDNVYSIDKKLESNENTTLVTDSIEKERNKLKIGRLDGKSIDDWEYKDLKKYCKNNFELEDYRSVLTAKKDELFNWICNHKVNLLEKGIKTEV